MWINGVGKSNLWFEANTSYGLLIKEKMTFKAVAEFELNEYFSTSISTSIFNMPFQDVYLKSFFWACTSGTFPCHPVLKTIRQKQVLSHSTIPELSWEITKYDSLNCVILIVYNYYFLLFSFSLCLYTCIHISSARHTAIFAWNSIFNISLLSYMERSVLKIWHHCCQMELHHKELHCIIIIIIEQDWPKQHCAVSQPPESLMFFRSPVAG